LLHTQVLLDPAQGATRVPDLEIRPHESQHCNAKPKAEFNTLMVHRRSSGLSWLLRRRVRPSKTMILRGVGADITKNDEVTRDYW
jgi:hypothetical protein